VGKVAGVWNLPLTTTHTAEVKERVDINLLPLWAFVACSRVKCNFTFPFYLYLYLTPVSLRFNPINAELNPICHLLALLPAHHILHVSK